MKDSSLRNLILKIPEDFFSKTSFIILIAFSLSLPFTMLYMAFFWDNMQGYSIVTCGTAAQLLIGLYLIYKLLQVNTPKLRNLLNFRLWDLLFLALLIWSGISAFLAEDYELAMMGTGYRQEGFTMYLTYASIYICSKLIKNERQQKILITTYGVSISLLSIMTFIQANPAILNALGTIGKNIQGQGFNCMKYAAIYPNINHYGYVLNMGIVALAGLSYISKGWQKWVCLVLFCFNTWALVINNTFGCYLAAFAGLVFLAILFAIRNKDCLKHFSLLIVLFIAISIATSATNDGLLFSNFSILGGELDGDEELFENDSAGSGRMGLWKQAIKYIGEKPIFGHGPEGLHYKYIEDGFNNDRPHNEYIQYAAFTGIPSLLLYLGALITMLVYCLKNLKELSSETVVIGGIIFAYCVSAFFGNTMYNTSIYFFMFIGFLSCCHKYLSTK